MPPKKSKKNAVCGAMCKTAGNTNKIAPVRKSNRLPKPPKPTVIDRRFMKINRSGPAGTIPYSSFPKNHRPYDYIIGVAYSPPEAALSVPLMGPIPGSSQGPVTWHEELRGIIRSELNNATPATAPSTNLTTMPVATPPAPVASPIAPPVVSPVVPPVASPTPSPIPPQDRSLSQMNPTPEQTAYRPILQSPDITNNTNNTNNTANNGADFSQFYQGLASETERRTNILGFTLESAVERQQRMDNEIHQLRANYDALQSQNATLQSEMDRRTTLLAQGIESSATVTAQTFVAADRAVTNLRDATGSALTRVRDATADVLQQQRSDLEFTRREQIQSQLDLQTTQGDVNTLATQQHALTATMQNIQGSVAQQGEDVAMLQRGDAVTVDEIERVSGDINQLSADLASVENYLRNGPVQPARPARVPMANNDIQLPMPPRLPPIPERIPEQGRLPGPTVQRRLPGPAMQGQLPGGYVPLRLQPPVHTPVQAPVEAPVQTPRQARGYVPLRLQAPTRTPVQAPIQAPIQAPLQTPVRPEWWQANPIEPIPDPPEVTPSPASKKRKKDTKKRVRKPDGAGPSNS